MEKGRGGTRGRGRERGRGGAGRVEGRGKEHIDVQSNSLKWKLAWQHLKKKKTFSETAL